MLSPLTTYRSPTRPHLSRVLSPSSSTQICNSWASRGFKIQTLAMRQERSYKRLFYEIQEGTGQSCFLLLGKKKVEK